MLAHTRAFSAFFRKGERDSYREAARWGLDTPVRGGSPNWDCAIATLQWPYSDGDEPPVYDHTNVDHCAAPIPDTQDSTRSCQKDVVHHGNPSPAPLRRALKCDLRVAIIARGCARYDGVSVRDGASTAVR